MGVFAEAAVDTFPVEAELLQVGLHLHHVVTDQVVARLVGQNAGAQGVGGLAQHAESEVIDEARGDDPAGLLEGLEVFAQPIVEVRILFMELAGL